MPYISKFTGTQIDDTISEVQEKKSTWDGKQEKISGRQGQYVGFDALGNAIASEIDIGGVVSSFNGRSGDVMPGNGDYTAEMVGARPADWMPTAEDVGALPDTVTIPTRTSQLINDSGFITDGEGGGDGSTPSGPVSAVDVGYNNVGSGLDATNAQEALDELAGEVSQLFTSGSEGKALIASAITAKGIETGADASFQEMADNISLISATPDNLYTIDVSASDPAAGTVGGGGTASGGMNVTVNAEAGTGYDFTGWKENDSVVASDSKYEFIVDRDRMLTADFSVATYTVTVAISPSGYGTVSGAGTYTHGQSVTVKATANSGYEFVSWKKNGVVVSSSASYTFTITENTYLTATFEQAIVPLGDWTSNSFPTTTIARRISYVNNRFIADEGTTSARYSTDGKTWTTMTLPETAYYYGDAAYGNGRYVIMGGPSTSVFAYSTNGTTWTKGNMPAEGTWFGVTYGNGKFVAVGMSSLQSGDKYAAYSTDGITWTATTMPVSATWHSVVYGNGKFVALSRSSISNCVAYSSDGITWTSSTMPVTSYWHDLAYGDGKFVAIADSGSTTVNRTSAYSTDGITWRSSTLPVDARWSSIAYGGGKFVAVSSYNSSNAIYSMDGGASWIKSTLPSASSWNNIAYGNGKFVTVSTSTGVGSAYASG